MAMVLRPTCNAPHHGTARSHGEEAEATGCPSFVESTLTVGSLMKSRQALGGGLLLPDVKVEFAGANLVLKTVSQRSPGQAVKIIAALEGRSLEILHAKISTVDDTAVNSFTVKVCTASLLLHGTAISALALIM
ncbi:hypothetical protein OsJ_21537 [Oryza sativa Japonica Group]|uniref:Uncharacterized protein n=1 Tax=Oryza sativa subsp. japonica TaxID=39947 RepID=B9FTJ6_ORYSJ|nr:hypothetical protein OsJ_21537 [Oryza sativa Japonica Group]